MYEHFAWLFPEAGFAKFCEQNQKRDFQIMPKFKSYGWDSWEDFTYFHRDK